MKDKEEKKKTGNKSDKSKDQEVDRRKFIEKSARDIGGYGFAVYEIAKTIKDEIVQEVVDNIKKTIRDA